MPDKDRTSDVPMIRRDDFSITRASSRLVKRGLTTLTESPKIDLDIHDLIAFGSSIFVCHSDWDAQPYDFANFPEVEFSDQHRQVVLYEFSHMGGYMRKLHLPLIRFSQAGYLFLSRRWPGPITIRQEFIHLSEELEFSDLGNSVRVDYLFSRTGERIAAWANGIAIDRHRAEDESLTPTNLGIEPVWFVGDRMLTIQPDVSGRTGATANFAVSCSVDELVKAVQNPAVFTDESGRHVSQVPTPVVSWREIDLRDELGNRSDLRIHAESVNNRNQSNDPEAAWVFIGGDRQYIGRIEMNGAEPTLVVFPNPGGRELLRSQVVPLPNGLTEADLYFWGGNDQSQLLSWGEDVLIEYYFQRAAPSYEFISRPVLMKVDDGRLEPIKTIEPQQRRLGKLTFSDGRLVYVSGHGVRSDGVLIYVSDHEVQSEIHVISVDTDRAFSFRPQVPRSQLKHGASSR